MKKLIALILVLVFVPVLSFADLPDLSGLSFDELIQLRDQLNLAIWNSDKWQQVKVPAGFYIIGKDIPAGHWTIKPATGDFIILVQYFKEVDETGKNVLDSFTNCSTSSLTDSSSIYADVIYDREVDYEFKEGFYLSISNGPYVIFEPYISKPAFEFK